MPRRTGRRPARQRPLAVDVLAALAGLGLGAVVAMGIGDETSGSIAADGGLLTAAGRLTGLVAAYAMVVVVVLIARLPVLERAIGQDRLVRWHRKLGPTRSTCSPRTASSSRLATRRRRTPACSRSSGSC